MYINCVISTETLNIEATDDTSECRNVISTENLNVDVIDDAGACIHYTIIDWNKHLTFILDKELIKVGKLSRKRRQG